MSNRFSFSSSLPSSCGHSVFLQDRGPYRGEGPLYTQGWVSAHAFGFPSPLFFSWRCKGRAPPGIVPERPRKPRPPPPCLSSPLRKGRRKWNSLITNPSLWTKRICIYPGAIESLHKTHNHVTPLPKPQRPQLSVEVKSLSLSPPHTLSLSLSLFMSQIADSSDSALPSSPCFPPLFPLGWCW